MLKFLNLLWHYSKVKRLTFTTRQSLILHQQAAFQTFQKKITKRSPYFAPYKNCPLHEWPLMNKTIMLQNFNEMNTAGISLEEAYQTAFKAEQSRDFSPKLKGHTIGLSSGTSGTRGVFLVSPQEQSRWAGTILAKLLPRTLFSHERIAFFLRANSNLYQSVDNRWLSFKFFDLFSNFETEKKRLIDYQPTILIAPAQVLYALAKSNLPINPIKVISVAEVLDIPLREMIESRFKRIDEVYQATEGFIASTCPYGYLHLNEDLLIIEEERIDEKRFIPIITDFNRIAQPIIRYRLDDILIKKTGSCPCKNPAQRLEAIEGRINDIIYLPADKGHAISIFSDLIIRAFAQVLPIQCDFQLTQTTQNTLQLYIEGSLDLAHITKKHLISTFEHLGVNTNKLIWQLITEPAIPSFTEKRRRIRCAIEVPPCIS